MIGLRRQYPTSNEGNEPYSYVVIPFICINSDDNDERDFGNRKERKKKVNSCGAIKLQSFGFGIGNDVDNDDGAEAKEVHVSKVDSTA